MFGGGQMSSHFITRGVCDLVAMSIGHWIDQFDVGWYERHWQSALIRPTCCFDNSSRPTKRGILLVLVRRRP